MFRESINDLYRNVLNYHKVTTNGRWIYIYYDEELDFILCASKEESEYYVNLINKLIQ